MAFGTQDDTDEVMNEINMTPLVDVMLVLLIIFIITVPVMKHAINIDLPRAANQAENARPETVRLSVDASGAYFWNEVAISDEQFQAQLALGAARQPQPELHIRGDRQVRYERVAQAMAAAQRAGIRKIGFITDPQTPLNPSERNAMESANPTTAPTQMPPERRPGAPPVPAPSMAQRPGQALDSQVLLQGQGSVAIQHNGVVYRLQATRLGKLILTK